MDTIAAPMLTASCRPLVFALALFLPATALAAEELITTAHYPNGEAIPYILNSSNAAPRYLLILFAGGDGNVNPRMQDGKLVYGFKNNFLLRARKHFVDEEFATVTPDASQSEERFQGLLDDLRRRFARAAIYLIGTSRGTFDTMRLAEYLSERIAGVIHTASLSEIASFDSRKYRNRQLLVHHRNDDCYLTPFDAAQSAHEKYGTELIALDGGTTRGNPCQAQSYHGFLGVEAEAVAAIKAWIKRGR